MIVTILSIVIPSVIELFNYIIFRQENVQRQKKFSKNIDEYVASFYRALISHITIGAIINIRDKTYKNILNHIL